MKKIAVAMVAGAFMLTVAGAGYADQTSVSTSYSGGAAKVAHPKGCFLKKRFEKNLKKLHLTPDQDKKIQALGANFWPQFESYMQKIKSDRVALAGFVGKQYNADKVSALATDYGATMTKLINLKMKFTNDIYILLTPKQQQKMMEIKQKYMMKRHHHSE